jgi:hypothetical protein
MSRITNRGRALRRPRTLLSLGAIGIIAAVAVPAVTGGASPAAASSHDCHDNTPPVHVSVITPSEHGNAGAGGVFNVDVSLQATSREANGTLSAGAGYRPFLNLPPAPTFGPGQPDPGAPGLVVLLSTTPAAAGGPNANLAGVFQLNGVERVQGLNTTFNDWQVGSAGFFGTDVDATLTVFVVAGTAPGTVNMSDVQPISNIVQVHFHEAA